MQKQVRETQAINDEVSNRNIYLLEPLQYLLFVFIIQKCALVFTDGGSIQEEVPVLGKPVLVMRSITERPEGIKAGTVRVTEPDKETIYTEVYNLNKK